MRQFMWILMFAVSVASFDAYGQPSEQPFSITISVADTEAKVSGPVLIHVELTNSSQEPLVVPEIRHDGTQGEYNYSVRVQGPGGAAVTDTEHGRRMKSGGEVMTAGSMLIKTLNPGDHIVEDIDLSKLVKLTAPGDYTVQVERSLPESKLPPVKSNRLVIHVVP